MDSSNIICPVCTLYLRAGITLKNHLASHPKHKVIEALVRLADPDGIQKNALSSPPSSSSTVITTTPTTPVTQQQQQQPPPSPPSHHQQNTTCPPGGNANSQINIVNQTWNQGNLMNMAPNVQQMQGNHLFIYQQSMSSTTGPQQNVLNVNQLSPQYVIPTVLNPQMMPYVYQQQQVIMSSGSCLAPPLRSLPYEIQTVTASPSPTIEQISDNNIIEIDKDPSKNQHSSIEDLTVDCNGDKHQKTITIKDDTDLQKLNTFIDLKFYDDDDNNNSNNNQDDGENHEHEQNYETNPSPHSPTGSDWSIRVRSDLSKACQTQNNNLSPRSVVQNDNIDIVEINTTKPDEPEFYFVDQQQQQQENDEHDIDNNSNTVIISQQDYKQSNPIYTTSNILQSNDHIDFVDMDGVQMVMNDFSTNQIISQVENFEGSTPDRPGVLMTIGGMVDDNHDESLSRESSNVNIRADERMPPRGELSGQESIDGTTNDTTWNRIQYDNGNPSYDNMFARDNWAGSDSSNIDAPPPYDEQENDDNDMPTIVSFSGPPLNFKCSTCGDAFQSTKERKQHEIEKHGDKTKLNHIGTEIGKKKVKKLIVRLKETKSENDNNFDNVFTNKLKLENPIIGNENGEIQTNNQNENLPTKIDDTTVDVKTICSLCEAVLPNLRALRDHKLQIHNISSQTRHKCTTCNQVFQNDYKFSEHLRIHPLECKLCGKLFYRRQNIQLHMRRHLGIKPYKCDVCEKSFLTKQKLQEHRNIHTGETPIKCNLCNETFRRYSNLVQHRNRHHLNVKKKVKDYICFCKEIFHSKTKLAWHKEIHDPKPKSCTQCSEKFIHMSSLTRHMRRAHNSHFLPNGHKSSENVECPICKGIYLKSSLEVHIKNHSGQRPYKCLICNKSFTTRWNLKLHKWTHASRVSKPFKCDQCKGAFIRESDYVAHMNSHKSIRPYTCNYCGAKFIRKSNCQRHVREHENDKTFTCKVCGKAFHRSYYLKDHMRIHTGVRPYSCHICGKTSTTKSNHNKHVQIHHAREPVSTEN